MNTIHLVHRRHRSVMSLTGKTALASLTFFAIGLLMPTVVYSEAPPSAPSKANAQLQPIPATATPENHQVLEEAAQSDQDRQAHASGQPERMSVLVTVGPGVARGPVRAFADQHGGNVKYEYTTVLPNVMNLRDLPRGAIDALQNIPGVMRVDEDTYDIRINLHDSTPLIRGLQSQITAADHSAAGAGARVCVVDTGIDSDHLMYADRIDTAAGWDFSNNDPNPEDDNGHGSHVSGIAVGGTGLSVDFGCGAGPKPSRVLPQRPP